MGKRSKKDSGSVYGEFIRTFTFGELTELPIVQPQGSLTFPISTVDPKRVKYIEDDNHVGLLVPRGTYLVSLVVNPGGEDSVVTLLVNGDAPTASTFKYTNFVTNGLLSVQFLINAPLKRKNLISVINDGPNLFSLNNIPNTTDGQTSLITKIRVQRLDN